MCWRFSNDNWITIGKYRETINIYYEELEAEEVKINAQVVTGLSRLICTCRKTF